MQFEPTPLAWSDAYAIGHAEIDEEHRQLFEIYNMAVRTVADGTSDLAPETLVKGIMDYADYHFATEQTAMTCADFPQFKAHVHEHDTLRFIVKAMLAERACEPDIHIALLGLLRVWIQGHILHSDAEFGRFLKARKTALSAPC